MRLVVFLLLLSSTLYSQDTLELKCVDANKDQKVLSTIKKLFGRQAFKCDDRYMVIKTDTMDFISKTFRDNPYTCDNDLINYLKGFYSFESYLFKRKDCSVIVLSNFQLISFKEENRIDKGNENDLNFNTCEITFRHLNSRNKSEIDVIWSYEIFYNELRKNKFIN